MTLSKKWKLKMLRGNVAAAAISSLFLLAACGDDSSSTKVTEPANDSSTVTKVETFDDLPACTAKHEGETAYVQDEKTAYVCEDEEWVVNDNESSSSRRSENEAISSSSKGKKVSSSSEEDSSQCDDCKAKENSSSSKNKSKSSSSVENESSSSRHSPLDEESSSSGKKETSSSSESAEAGDCLVTDGVKVFAPKGGELFQIGETITVVYGSDVEGSGYRFVFKTSEDDAGIDLLEESAGPEKPNGRTCYEQKVVLKKNVAEPTGTAIIRVIPYEKTSKGASSGTFKVITLEGWSWDVPKEMRLNPEIEYGTVTETAERGGQTYKTVTIGSGNDKQTWMAENLNYYDETLDGHSWCYGAEDSENTPNCAVTGRLYTWAAAIDSVGIYKNLGLECGHDKDCTEKLPEKIQGICPNGWRLPTNEDWELLFKNAGGQEEAYQVLKSRTGWYIDKYGKDGTDDLGFSALPAGYGDNQGHSYDVGKEADFWSFTDYYSNNAYVMILNLYSEKAVLAYYGKNNGYSIRCLKD